MVDRISVKCLVVDDDHDGAEIVGEFFRASGAEVRVVYGGREAIDIASHFHPDIVVLDIHMPDVDGFETCRILRQQRWSRDAVFVAYTGLPDPKVPALSVGFDRVVSKGDSPVVFETILNGLPQR
jgi:CheY-like chemotaxis protein